MKEQINGWLARDSWGSLTFYEQKPKRIPGTWMGFWHSDSGRYMTVPQELFPKLKFEDQPQKVTLIIETI